ncbi:hypothetical protein E1263_05110 [Kribbella antibiotica]|uniref:Uncharacterized protein n=1 Tax=Kribbella antibiotica TaxID=190195 RepID=A0A4R4ZSE7_9ACTN|nr:hypothetical protein [Kribbella antibiotica]TDD61998.1 hypothetical protein E1263_05110 [Kribbella antibiotica]
MRQGKRKLIVTAVVAAFTLLVGATAPATAAERQPASAAAAPPKAPTALGKSLQFGGGYTGVTYDDLWDAHLLAKLWVDTTKPVHVTAYFGAWPEFNSQGQPSDAKATLVYTWQWICGAAAPVNLSSQLSTTLEPAPGTTMFNYWILDALKVEANLTAPACPSGGRFSIRFNTVESTGSPGAMNSPDVGSLPAPFGTPGSDILNGTSPTITLYQIGTPNEVAEVRKSGKLKDIPSTGLRYFVSDCKAAQDLVGWAAATMDPYNYGVFKYTIPRSAVKEGVGKISGAWADKPGRPRITAFAVRHGAPSIFNDPSSFVVIKDAFTCF